MNRTTAELKRPASDLVAAVQERPGIHFRELARAADISSMGQLRHHVDRLREDGWLVEIEDGRYKRFFITGRHPPALRQTLARFSRPVPLRIGQLLLGRPMSRGELRRNLGCADSTLGYHLARMCLDGDILKIGLSGRCQYALADPETVRSALLLRNVGPHEAEGRMHDRPRAHPTTTPSSRPDTSARRMGDGDRGPTQGRDRAPAPTGETDPAGPRTAQTWPNRPRRKTRRPGHGCRQPLARPEDRRRDDLPWDTRLVGPREIERPRQRDPREPSDDGPFYPTIPHL